MLTKIHAQHSKNKNYLKPKSDINQVFGLNHFAGVVFYHAKGLFFKVLKVIQFLIHATCIIILQQYV